MDRIADQHDAIGLRARKLAREKASTDQDRALGFIDTPTAPVDCRRCDDLGFVRGDMSKGDFGTRRCTCKTLPTTHRFK